MKAAVADDLHDAIVRSSELHAERHAAAEAESAAARAQHRMRTGARDLVHHRQRIADRLVDDDVVGAYGLVERRAQEIRRDRVTLSRPRRGSSDALHPLLALRLQALHAGAPLARGTRDPPARARSRAPAAARWRSRPARAMSDGKPHIGKSFLIASTSTCIQRVRGFSFANCGSHGTSTSSSSPTSASSSAVARLEAGEARRIPRDVDVRADGIRTPPCHIRARAHRERPALPACGPDNP